MSEVLHGVNLANVRHCIVQIYSLAACSVQAQSGLHSACAVAFSPTARDGNTFVGQGVTR